MIVRLWGSAAIAGWMGSAAVAITAAATPQAVPVPVAQSASVGAVVKQYCVGCHNARVKNGELSLENVDTMDIPAHADVWERVVRKMQRHAMPPEGARRPDEATYDGVLRWLEAELDRGEALHPSPAQPLPHRLNRAEYANAVRDLLALDLGDVSTLLPADDSTFGFDNIAEALGFSSVLLERYVTVGGRL